MQSHAAINEYLDYHHHKLTMGIIRPATVERCREMAVEAASGLPDVDVSSLNSNAFDALLRFSSSHWGAQRLKHLKHWISGWLRWLENTGRIDRVPKTGPMETPRHRPTPKQVYTPGELKELWVAGTPLTRALLGLGLYAGMNCADVAELTAEHVQGQWMVQPRTKTGIPRRAYLPSGVVSVLDFPLRTSRGPIHRRQVSTYWRDTTRRLWGAPRPFTALRTTLRTVAGHVDAEAMEMCVMGHTPASAAAELGRNRVGLEHYVRADAISEERLRAITRAVTDWLSS